MGFLESLHVTSTGGFLAIGFLMGMIHAFETDHLAAISTLITENRKQLILRGAVWGLGHTATLLLLSMAVLLLGFVLTEARAAALEFAVGVMLVVLGADVLRRMRRARLHVHAHRHGDHGLHLHVHGHPDAHMAHSHDAHDHPQAAGFPLRALVIGLVHGAAGSAAIIVLAAAAAGNIWVTLAYVALVGLGSVLGMAAISALISLPLGLAPKNIAWLNTAARLVIAVVAISFGVIIMRETGSLAAGIF
ncbi:MAG TPA: high frequency lysogenization protein HflD [Aliiroseovarius sp.]|nr:high frequency lysogenization protein HflD [Aliiroseovarius sp.]